MTGSCALAQNVLATRLLACADTSLRVFCGNQGAILSIFTSFPHFLVALSVFRDGGHTAHYGGGERFFLRKYTALRGLLVISRLFSERLLGITVFSLFCSAGSIMITALSRVQRQRMERCVTMVRGSKADGDDERGSDMYDELLSGSRPSSLTGAE